MSAPSRAELTPSTTWAAAFAAWEPFCSSHNQVTACPIWVRQCCGHRQGWTCLFSPAAAAGSWGPALGLSLCSPPEGQAQGRHSAQCPGAPGQVPPKAGGAVWEHGSESTAMVGHEHSRACQPCPAPSPECCGFPWPQWHCLLSLSVPCLLLQLPLELCWEMKPF